MFLAPLPPDESFRQTIQTPFGAMVIQADARALTGLDWRERARRPPDRPSPLTARAADDLAAYFAGALTAFDLPLAPRGTAHERQVWAELCRIPHGETITYGELARRTGTVPRAVGGTCGANPIAIVIPCHRVTAAGGALGGYSGAGGADTKRRLLAFEARISGRFTLTA